MAVMQTSGDEPESLPLLHRHRIKEQGYAEISSETHNFAPIISIYS
jgi:hypothetical protein